MSSTLDPRLAARLGGVVDPELGADVVSLGMVTSAVVDDAGVAHLGIALTTIACPLRARLERDVHAALAGLEGVREVSVEMGELDPSAKADLMDTARRLAQDRAPRRPSPAPSRSSRSARAKVASASRR